MSDDARDLADIEARLDAHATRMKALEDELDDVREERDALRDDVEALHEENEELREEIDRLHARTDLLRLVENSDQMTGRQRSMTLIQHLKKAAEKQRDRDRDAKASVNREEAESALQYPDVDRTTLYDDMRRAERLVDNKSVLRYDSASGGESRLRLNLEAGDLPGEVLGTTEDGGR